MNNTFLQKMMRKLTSVVKTPLTASKKNEESSDSSSSDSSDSDDDDVF